MGDYVSGRRPLIRSGESQQIHSAYSVRLRGLESLLKSNPTVGITPSLPCPRDGNGRYWMFFRARIRTRKCVKDTCTRIRGLAPPLTGTTWHGIHHSKSQCKVVMFFTCIRTCVHARL